MDALLSPRFLKIAKSPPSVCLSVMLSPPKSLDKINPNLVCELHDWGVQQLKNFGPGEGSKGGK